MKNEEVKVPNVTNRLYLETLAHDLECDLARMENEHMNVVNAYRDKYSALEHVMLSIRAQLKTDDKRKVKDNL